ncbi:ATP-binding protein [Candidiatus Paracoxiella cheracis]|uniref:ATP-binding protein n=1 Tax=Candidiatus Paracoxiella cheracis TaxID=3405120 RepID=UPI003BF4F3D4
MKRIAEATMQRFLSSFPVLGLTGPRQSGKSTLLQHALTDYRYVSFDNIGNVDYFESDPEGFIAQYDDRVIFDEVQFVPKLFNYIKVAVDNDRQNYGKFVLTGSSQFSYLKNISESLAGRIGLMSLLPLQYAEMPKALLTESIYQGAYPELVIRDYRESELWYASYLETYLNKDVRVLSNIGDMRDFSRFIRLLAAQVTKTIDLSHYAKDLGVSAPTIKRWLSILEASYIIFLLPAYYNNLGKRIIKSPKIYFYDTGLISYLAGIKTFDQYDKGPMNGAIFENYVVSEILKKNLHSVSGFELYYFRTSDKTEIDLIVDKKDSQDFIEIKKTSTFYPKFVSALKKFCDENRQGYLLYNGKEFPFKENINIINYAEYLI